jgi:hypothetical protein
MDERYKNESEGAFGSRVIWIDGYNEEQRKTNHYDQHKTVKPILYPREIEK